MNIHFDKLPEPFRTQAERYREIESAVRTHIRFSKNVPQAIMDGFRWSNTIESVRYWNCVFNIATELKPYENNV